MKPKPAAFNAQQGQVLPLALAGFVASMLLFLFLVKAGGLLVQRERASLRTDITAFSIGVDYARSLNVLAVSEKLVGTGQLASFLPIVGPAAQKTVKLLQKAQQALLKFGPWLNEASALQIGAQNGLIAVPLWNTRDVIQDLDKDSFVPDYRVHARGLLEFMGDGLKSLLGHEVDEKQLSEGVRDLEKELKAKGPQLGLDRVKSLLKKQLPDVNVDWLFKKDGYSYQPKAGGDRVYVPGEEGSTRSENKAGGGRIDRSREDASHKFVHPESWLDQDMPLDLVDDGPHSITLIAPLVPRLDPQARHDQPWLWSIAQVQIAGGTMDYFSWNGAGYAPFFAPVRASFKLQAPGSREAAELLQSLPFDVSSLSHLAGAPRVFQVAGDILAIQH